MIDQANIDSSVEQSVDVLEAQHSTHSSSDTLQNQIIEELIAMIANLRREFRQVQSQNASDVIASSSQATLSSFVIATFATSQVIFKIKIIKLDSMSKYKRANQDEHIRWFREIDLKFLESSNYFSNDRFKILFCMKSFRSDSTIQWFQHINNDHNLKNIIFVDFEQFLLDLMIDSTNRRLLVYERWIDAMQKSNQKIFAFKTYLKKIKNHMLSFVEMHRANFLLIKLKNDLKNKILNTREMSHTREEILVKTIMQKKTLKRNKRVANRSNKSEKHSSNDDQHNLKKLENFVDRIQSSSFK